MLMFYIKKQMKLQVMDDMFVLQYYLCYLVRALNCLKRRDIIPWKWDCRTLDSLKVGHWDIAGKEYSCVINLVNTGIIIQEYSLPGISQCPTESSVLQSCFLGVMSVPCFKTVSNIQVSELWGPCCTVMWNSAVFIS